jgi:hypothetical protein
MRTSKRAVLPASVTLLAVAAALLAGVAAAQPAGGEVHVWESDTATTNAIVLTGAVSDYGTDHEGVAGTHHQINKLVLSKGTFEVNVGKLAAKTHMDTASCTLTGHGTGPVPIVDGSGTGAYAGITGTTRAALTVVIVLPKTAAGKCAQNGKPLTDFGFVTATGKVSIG